MSKMQNKIQFIFGLANKKKKDFYKNSLWFQKNYLLLQKYLTRDGNF